MLYQGNQKTNNFIILVFGLPASGKSTFSQQLKSNEFFPQTLYIQSDKVEAFFLSNPQLKTKDFVNQSIDRLVDFLSKLEQKHFPRVRFDAENWKQSRNFTEEAVQKLVANKYSVIVEDDLLYKSQRKVFRKFSWLYQCGYLEIFMDSSLDQCLQNLSNRNQENNIYQLKDCILDKQVILKANEKLQVDKTDKYTVCLTISNRKTVSKQQIEQNVKVVQIVPNDPNDPNFKYEEKPQHEHSSQQMIDIETRRYVGILMKKSIEQLQQQIGQDLIGNNNLTNKQNLSKFLTNWKKQFVKCPQKSISHSIMRSNIRNRLKMEEK